MNRITSLHIIVLSFLLLVFSAGAIHGDNSKKKDVRLIMRDGSTIDMAAVNQPPPLENANISARDRFVKWKSLRMEGMVYTHDNITYKLTLDQMMQEFLTIELMDADLKPYKEGRMTIETRSGKKFRVTDATLLSYMGHPDGVSEILAIEYDGFNRFWKEVFMDIREVRVIFLGESRPYSEADYLPKVLNFAADADDIRKKMNSPARGEYTKDSVKLNIEFDFDSYRIRNASVPLLGELGNALVVDGMKGKRIILKGHTDSIGTERYNQDLSLKRAREVRKFLVSKFVIPPSTITTAGYGETMPLVPNTTSANRQINRRVEIRLADN